MNDIAEGYHNVTDRSRPYHPVADYCHLEYSKGNFTLELNIWPLGLRDVGAGQSYTFSDHLHILAGISWPLRASRASQALARIAAV